MSLRCLLLVVIVVFISTEAVSDECVKKAVGDQVSFYPDKSLPPNVTSIIWKHINTDGITVKAIEWDEGEILIPNPRFKNITTVDEKTGQITITNLTVEHSGVYTLEINSKEQQQRFNLTVMKRVPKPVMKTERSKVNPDVVYLICEYNETIIWKNSAGEKLNGSELHPKGETLVVKNEGNPVNFYTCTLDNGASEETSDPLYERDLFEAVDVMKAVGDQVSFRPDNFVPPVTSIIWKHINTDGITVKAIEWDEGEIIIPNPRIKDITAVDEKTGQITITNLTVEHSGVYTIDINSKEQQQRFTLTVMKRVPKPVIKIEPSDNPNVVYLRCEYSEPIIWKNSAGETLTGSKITPKGESVTVKSEGNPVNFYTCTLDNGASKETSDPVYKRDLFQGEDVYKVGGRVSFRPDNFVPPPVTSIIWKHINTAGTTVKAIEWDEGEILIPNPRFQNITTVDEKTGQITITNLKVEHSGVYTLDINSKEQKQRFNLTVEEPVPKPVIKVEKIKDNPDVVYLACNYSHKIIWDNSAREVLKISKLHPTGESITVQKKEGNLDNVYTCTLKNRVSEETSDPVYKNKLFKGTTAIYFNITFLGKSLRLIFMF
ncbi:CD48 antigen [Anabarilius grahami]|uniref:CD48 antigen n=1 Tax=Anabarilius grahami TaxID=495550 RepID=A0A3N0XL60_ANAGA|nr:CD48 antigen [Anabarilius grahami]